MSQQSSVRSGVIFALCAYTMWGIAPIYFKALADVPPIEILMHRVVWAFVLLSFLIVGLRHIGKVKAAIKSTRVLITLMVASTLLACNWFLYIWAVNNDFILEASLGYYINPLINVFLGRLFLGETLRMTQKVAVGVAVTGVLIMIFNFGYVPWIALTLAMSFSIYGLLRKQVSVDSLPGLFIETLFLFPAAIIYWLFFATQVSDLSNNTSSLNVLLLLAGVVSTAPLLCFTAAARRIRYSTLGFFQYIGPSLMFVLAVTLYNEQLSTARLVTFCFVWVALALFTFDTFKHYRREMKEKKLAALRPE
ncbi:EamA family transporter RarD [Brumicola pallidula]|uniref:Chloramphenicol-sensitive protein RarD n=1 Tax=Brumicola pallidula DSM 14239 = ACAM 615 TaxID=1121922 RepID=K6YD14_9ALTE|nr:EamA family transporter RarD [Glaciecola pallidula]GAC30634.1 chloramphenicol-sensitive protein RarD [Glaciecola pallidula DSM 14239 = ACAM 615]